MADRQVKTELSKQVHDFVTASFKPQFGKLKSRFASNPVWQKMKGFGTQLWLDTGSMPEAEKLYTQEFSALTTNNTLLNKEIQTGLYDSLIGKAAALMSEFPELSDKQRMLEIAFILNAWHGLRLVEKFDCFVSVEEHTDLADDLETAVKYALRYRAICPERFIVKLPFTPAGLLATRKIVAQGVTVNHTLGFSARQNYVIARIGKPAYVNVFLGRLNSFTQDNKLGDGSYIGEKATIASQKAMRALRKSKQAPSLQIGASFRSGAQVRDLAGLDVMTMPPKVAGEFLALNMTPAQVVDKTGSDYKPGIDSSVKQEAVRFDTLWDIDDKLVKCVDAVEKENLDSFTAGDIVDFFEKHGCGDLMPRWTDTQIATSTKEGKIPQIGDWKDVLAAKKIGLDSLMNLAGLNSFKVDQKAMDDRVRDVLAKNKAK